ncbi:hypothetical protein AXG93_2334s1000 [Marchantia polymorpha subsp. ruderalis]|uniref:Uncharacterized protein n=1 Tax=Marchantia polymorpha subsp. ruderalis TaxID=1480154 RepID=A0A176W4C2_MARPO|nr:hypothetical protein AXG93_2334s1000 [Marchantia polymorpha subsp. ruderalis]
MVGYMILLNSSWTNVVSALDEHEPNPNVKHRTACVGSTVFSGTGRDTTGNEKARWQACPQGQFTIPRTISRGGINNHSEKMLRIYWIIRAQSSTGNTRCLSMRLGSEVDTAGQPPQLRRGSIMNSMHISNARQAGRKAESSSWFSTVNRNLPMRIEGRALSVHARPVDCVVTLQNGVNEMLEAKLLLFFV